MHQRPALNPRVPLDLSLARGLEAGAGPASGGNRCAPTSRFPSTLVSRHRLSPFRRRHA